ncbi:deoxyribose-phosphate aldolase [Corallincola spongiicola]|nr:deoxyribose-phosphate aldolase [Corallincola spongiicola]
MNHDDTQTTSPELAGQLFALMDFTSLNQDDDESAITQLCHDSCIELDSGDLLNVAALCVYPRWVSLAKQLRPDNQTRIATVANFPAGDAKPATVMHEVSAALEAGADEIDLVIPYRAVMAGQWWLAAALVKSVRRLNEACVVKVIIESGELQDVSLIRTASQLALDEGADFIKTSTGKVAVNATLEAAKVMLECIREHGNVAGFKAAGGIRTMAEASDYYQLVKQTLGADALTAKRFRLGASSLRQSLLQQMHTDGVLNDAQGAVTQTGEY